MMNKIKQNHQLKRIGQLILHPSQEWLRIQEEPAGKETIFRTFFMPFCVAVSFVILLISTLRLNFIHALGYAFINVISNLAGIYIVSLLIEEYLNGKSPKSDNTALSLTIYSSVVFLLFHSLSVVFGNNFLSQLTSLFSLIFLRTLYTGIHLITDLPANQKTNLFIITGLAIIFIPVIIHKLLMILFHIPVFNV